MTNSSHDDLAKRGDPGAIASFLNAVLEVHQVSVSVDRESGRLSIGLYAAEPLDQRYLVAIVTQELQALQLERIDSITLFGYTSGEFVPQWSQAIDLVAAPKGSFEAKTFLPKQADPEAEEVEHFLVCGLGSLGQYCVVNLKKFATGEVNIHIAAIDKVEPDDWEVDDLPEQLTGGFFLGNCCRDDVLLKAGVQQCRAILIVTSNESVNIETAIAAHKLTRRTNPLIRIIVRSSKINLNEYLKERLGNFVAFEATELPARSFALAGLGEGMLDFFDLSDRRLRVVELEVKAKDYRFRDLPAHLLHRRDQRLISLISTQPLEPTQLTATRSFYQWQPETRISPGDKITYIELLTVSTAVATLANGKYPLQRLRRSLRHFTQNPRQKMLELWEWIQAQQTRQIIGLGLVTATVLWAIGSVLLRVYGNMNLPEAMFAAVVLLLGGYGDMFGVLVAANAPPVVQLVCLLITLVSLLFVLGVLGLIAENLLSSRFDFFKRRSPVPEKDHIVLLGLGRVGQRVANLLHRQKYPLVAITDNLDNITLVPEIPVLVGNPIASLKKANLATARSVILVTDDQMQNLEAALIAKETAQQHQHPIDLIVRTSDQRFSANLIEILPDAKALSAYELSAEAFVGSAFGENILSLFRLNNQTILVAEYFISQADTLVNKVLAQVAYGYGVVPVFHRKGRTVMEGEVQEGFMPYDDMKLQAGDRLVVLSSINGLRRIERGELLPPPRWQLSASKPLNQTFLLDARKDLSKIANYDWQQAGHFLDNLPNQIELSLYTYQAYRLEQELRKNLPITLKPIE